MVLDIATELAQLAGRLELDVLSDGRPANPVVMLPLDQWRDAPPELIDRAARLVAGALPVTVGVLTGPPSPGLQALIAAATLTLGEPASADGTRAVVPLGDIPGAPNPREALGRLRAAIDRSPRAAIACGRLLRQVSMGLVPGAGGSVSVPRRIGRWRAAWLTLTGDRLPAPTALRWGLVDEITRTARPVGA
jgi:hypothetical protein